MFGQLTDGKLSSVARKKDLTGKFTFTSNDEVEVEGIIDMFKNATEETGVTVFVFEDSMEGLIGGIASLASKLIRRRVGLFS